MTRKSDSTPQHSDVYIQIKFVYHEIWFSRGEKINLAFHSTLVTQKIHDENLTGGDEANRMAAFSVSHRQVSILDFQIRRLQIWDKALMSTCVNTITFSAKLGSKSRARKKISTRHGCENKQSICIEMFFECFTSHRSFIRIRLYLWSPLLALKAEFYSQFSCFHSRNRICCWKIHKC